MSEVTLQPPGLVDAENHVFFDKLGISAMQFYINTTVALPPDYHSFFTMFCEGSDLMALVDAVDYSKLPPSAIQLFAGYKAIVDACQTMRQTVIGVTYQGLKDLFMKYATEAHDHYQQFLDLLDKIRADMLAKLPPNATDRAALHQIIEDRAYLSNEMKDTASDLVTDLQKITSTLTETITNINKAVTELKVVIVLTPTEQADIASNAVLGFVEKFLLTEIGFEPYSQIVTTRTQKLLDDTAPAANEMEAEMGRWDAITHDLTTVESWLSKEETAVGKMAGIDHAQVLSKWKHLGDVVLGNPEGATDGGEVDSGPTNNNEEEEEEEEYQG